MASAAATAAATEAAARASSRHIETLPQGTADSLHESAPHQCMRTWLKRSLRIGGCTTMRDQVELHS